MPGPKLAEDINSDHSKGVVGLLAPVLAFCDLSHRRCRCKVSNWGRTDETKKRNRILPHCDNKIVKLINVGQTFLF